MKNDLALSARSFDLYSGIFVFLEYKFIPYIDSEGEKGNCNFGDHAGIFISYKGIITANVDHSTVHKCPLVKTRPWLTGAGDVIGISPYTSQQASAGARSAP